ncbi:MsnO8 family LLM class oxidoreductase [Arthrobacter sp. Br18]|uniref:MsnO8 family LLM class oxidoreductase n=1 Tax=Arthrobacter sp. Br18 TaxID=1312954 RepID=UPI00047A8A11|nr:MsnO8 family LLM class oxidoreductase [Arthrobacter sp. Br18]
MPFPTTRFSILDRANARRGSSEADALGAVVERAERAEALGYHRFWVAEHHGVPGIVGSAPAVLMAAIAARTGTIRVGSGGIMLPNHQPLVVAEQAATLAALHPGRIDLGVGRSIGFTSAVRDALRSGEEASDRFEADVLELLAYLSGSAAITARPRNHSATPVFVLATGAGVQTAARAGLGVVIGGPALSRRNSNGTIPAVEQYRAHFRPSAWRDTPFVMVSADIAVADTSEAALEQLLPEAHAMAMARTRGEFPPLEPMARGEYASVSAREKKLMDDFLATSVHGTLPEVERRLEQLLSGTGADEVLVSGGAYDQGAQRRSDELLAALFA